MVLSRKKISDLIAGGKLLENTTASNIKNASYSLSIGKVFRPESGAEIVFGNNTSGNEINHIIQVKPNEVIVIMSKERIKLPLNICASYNPTFSISKRGLSLVNNSMIEPGYDGYLSCILANFSKNIAKLSLDESIVKLVFYELSPKVDQLDGVSEMNEEVIAKDIYTNAVAKIASDFHPTFLDIDSLEKRITDKSADAVKKQVILSSILISFLLLWATLQPIFSKWIYKNDIEDNYTLKGELIERILKLEKTDSINKNKIQSLEDSLSSYRGKK